jgi:tetratricopeptide (TPR) repeat protein
VSHRIARAALVTAGALVVGAFTLVSCRPPVSRKAAASPPIKAQPVDVRQRDSDIELFERRRREDPQSATDRTMLAQMYLARGRETGSFEDIRRAERLARESLALRKAHNSPTYAVLASALLSQHEFSGALVAARRLVALDPESASNRALLGEVLLETGAYEEADTLFRSLEGSTDRLTVAARLTRWYELTGRLGQASTVARYAALRALDEPALSAEQAAWFQLRRGELALKSGDFAAADSAFALGLRVFPGDYRILAAQCRSAAMRGEWKRAIDAGERAIETQPDPATLGVLSDAWAALGDSAQAAAYARAMTASALTQPGAIHRAWGLYLLDHGVRPADVLARVRRELRTRHDVYGYDLLAWSLHMLGRDTEAEEAIQVALSRHTEDAQLWYHGSAILHALGRDGEAAVLLDRALALNAQFAPRPLGELATLRSALADVSRPSVVAGGAR